MRKSPESKIRTRLNVTLYVHFLFCSPLNFYLFFYRLLPALTLSSSGNVNIEGDGGVLIYWVDTVWTATQDEDTERLVVEFRYCFAHAPNNSAMKLARCCTILNS